MSTLTRRALSCFTRWLQQGSPGRRAMLDTGLMSDAEARSLARLERNIDACGAPASWWADSGVDGRLRGRVLDTLLADLCLRDGVGAGLVAQVIPGLVMPRRILLEQALSKWLREHPERVAVKIGRRQEEPDMATQYERVAAVVERFPGLLEMEVPKAAKERLGELAGGVPALSAGARLSTLRREAGRDGLLLKPWADPPGWNGAQTATVTASTPAAPAADPGDPGEPRAAPEAAAGAVEPVAPAGTAPGTSVEKSTDWRREQEAGQAARRESLPPSEWAKAASGLNGHMELTAADRQLAIEVAAGIIADGTDVGTLSIARRRAVLDLAARLLAVAEA